MRHDDDATSERSACHGRVNPSCARLVINTVQFFDQLKAAESLTSNGLRSRGRVHGVRERPESH